MNDCQIWSGCLCVRFRTVFDMHHVTRQARSSQYVIMTRLTRVIGWLFVWASLVDPYIETFATNSLCSCIVPFAFRWNSEDGQVGSSDGLVIRRTGPGNIILGLDRCLRIRMFVLIVSENLCFRLGVSV